MSLRYFRMLVLPALLTAGCGCAARLPGDATILTGAAVPQMLQQCSRGAPSAGEASWQPAASHILALEALLPGALDVRRYSGDLDWTKAPQGWRRQYVGIVRDGRRFIYGNFFPRRDDLGTLEWRSQAVQVCDGGPVYFGVEYDVERGVFTQLDFNGAL